MYRKMLGAVVLAATAVGLSRADEGQDDAFLGDWQGKGLVAQVIPRGGGQYQINLLGRFDDDAKPLKTLAAKVTDGALPFELEGWKGEFQNGQLRVFQAGQKPSRHDLVRVKRPSPTLGAKAPEGAVTLFDGSSFERWEAQGRGEPPADIVWELHNGCMRVAPTNKETRAGHSLVTKDRFKDFRMHLEFRLPLMADKTGQARANGGVAFEDPTWYELQILDSYGLEGRDNECGGLYKIAAPKVNMCRPPLVWQTYDIEFHAPRYGTAGERQRAGKISVAHNGRQIHQDVELPDSPNAQRRRKSNPGAVSTGRIILHYHKDPIEYRNIWLKEL
jgi:hypothetical protein